MRIIPKSLAATAVAALILASAGEAQPPTGELKAKVEAKMKELATWGVNPEVVSAVKDHNTNPPPDAKGMTQEKWKQLSVLDPFVRSYTKNPLATTLKTKKEDWVSECF